MRRVTATEAARRFSEVLNAVENRGETFVVTRNGREVARIEPAPRATWGELVKLLREHPPDPEWADELRALRASLPAPEPQWTD